VETASRSTDCLASAWLARDDIRWRCPRSVRYAATSLPISWGEEMPISVAAALASQGSSPPPTAGRGGRVADGEGASAAMRDWPAAGRRQWHTPAPPPLRLGAARRATSPPLCGGEEKGRRRPLATMCMAGISVFAYQRWQHAIHGSRTAPSGEENVFVNEARDGGGSATERLLIRLRRGRWRPETGGNAR
jgi:hypothetical protein